MNPIRKSIPTQIVRLVTVIQNACETPLGVIATAPISVMPRFSSRSPALAHTTIARTMTSVLIRSRFSLAMEILSGRLVVARNRCGAGHRNHRLFDVAALPHPLQSLRAQFQEARRLMVQTLPFVAVPQRLTHNPPRNFKTEIIIVIEAC